jgi:hypothetical protein
MYECVGPRQKSSRRPTRVSSRLLPQVVHIFVQFIEKIMACSLYSNCGTCVAAAGCGWCETSYSCLSGSSSGPYSGICAYWDYYANDCPGYVYVPWAAIVGAVISFVAIVTVFVVIVIRRRQMLRAQRSLLAQTYAATTFPPSQGVAQGQPVYGMHAAPSMAGSAAPVYGQPPHGAMAGAYSQPPAYSQGPPPPYPTYGAHAPSQAPGSRPDGSGTAPGGYQPVQY